MKWKLKLLLLVVLFYVLSCTQSDQTSGGGGTDTVIRETYNVSQTAKIQKVFPVPAEWSKKEFRLNFGRVLFSAEQGNKDDDFDIGRMYRDNSYPYDSLYHILDLSPLIGEDKNAIVFLIVKWVDGNTDYPYYFNAYFRPAEINVEFDVAYAKFGELSSMVKTITNEEGQIQWYHEYTFPFEEWLNGDIEELWMDVEIWAVYYDDSGIINN